MNKEAFIVEEYVAYEGSSIVDVFSTQAKAITFATTYGDIDSSSKVDEKGWSASKNQLFIKSDGRRAIFVSWWILK